MILLQRENLLRFIFMFTKSSAIADKPRVLFCKVVEVLQDVLSENV